MKHETKFFICKHCGNLTGLINDAGVPMVCCGENMTEIKANTVDASQEKHVPVVTISGTSVKAKIGSVDHPMVEEHYIQWIYLETAQGGQRKNLKPGDKPEVTFAITADDKVISVYEYCNLHGLWKTSV